MDRRNALRLASTITGWAIATPFSTAFLNGCKTGTSAGWKPEYLTPDEYTLVSSICDQIIPETESPGAIELGIPAFIDTILLDCYAEKPDVKGELKTFRERIRLRYNTSFNKCTDIQKVEALNLEEDKINDRNWVSPYRTIKELTVLGYLSSEYVMKNILHYTPIPVDFSGCISIDDDARLNVSNTF